MAFTPFRLWIRQNIERKWINAQWNSIEFEDIFLYESEFLFIGRVGVVPLLHIRQAVPKGAIAGHLSIRTQTTGGHERDAKINNFFLLTGIKAKINNMILFVKFHIFIEAEALRNEITGQLSPQVGGPWGLRPISKR